MWIGYALHGQRGRQGVLYGAGGGRGVGPQDDRVRARPRPLKIRKIGKCKTGVGASWKITQSGAKIINKF